MKYLFYSRTHMQKSIHTHTHVECVREAGEDTSCPGILNALNTGILGEWS